MNPTGLLMVVLGVFIAGRVLFKDSKGETLVGRLAGGQPSSNQITVSSTGTAANVSTNLTGLGNAQLKASNGLTSDQASFAADLAKDTGLNVNVIKAWLLQEENGSAATSRQTAGNNDWLNIGYTDSGTYGASDSVWSTPSTAAAATAAWLNGANMPGFGTASAGIRSILSAAGQSAAAQIKAIQTSGWASSGEPALPSLYDELTGGN